MEPETCEDHFAVRLDAAGRSRAAVADGASESLFAGLWAELLADAYCDATGTGVALPPLEPLRRQWQAHTAATNLPWHAEEKRARGAAAALVGVALSPPDEDGCRWDAVAVGDSCLFIVRGGARLLVSFPVKRSDDFSGLPRLLHTIPGAAGAADPDPHRAQGRVQEGDDLYLMSDALGAWFLGESERGREPWRWFVGLQDRETFAERIRQLRTDGRLRDDDVTLVHLSLSTNGWHGDAQ
jgi:hypothetical protein